MIPDKAYIPFLDVIRVSACWLVIMLHLCSTRFFQFSDQWMIYMGYEAISRICVPLFFMLTGFLLLDRPIGSLKSFYIKRYTRLLLPFAIICIAYYYTPEYEGISVWSYLEKIILSYADFHLWYVYALLGIYLLLPFFSAYTSTPSGMKLNILFVSLWIGLIIFLYTLLKYFCPDIKILDHYHLNFLATYMGYVIIGWLIKKTLVLYTNKIYITSFIIFSFCIICIIGVTNHISVLRGYPDEFFFGNFTPFVCFASISFFIFSTRLGIANTFIRDISDKTYWIYLLHLLVLRYFIFLMPLPHNYSVIILIPAYTTLIFLFCYLTAIPLRKMENVFLRIMHI